MNKKIFKLVASAIALTLCACGNDSTSPEDDPASSTSEIQSSTSKDQPSSSSSKDTSSSSKEKSSSSEKVSSSSEETSSSSDEPESSSSEDISSSSEEISSSSEDISSSSEQPFETGVLIDTRDNQTYKTVKIGTTNWMAQNLNYNFNDNYGNSCPNNDEENCAKFGRFYSLGTAMDSSAVFSSNGRRCGTDNYCEAQGAIRGICPKDWRLPNKNDFAELIEIAGGANQAGMNLKATTSWTPDDNASPATDLLGFSMFATGLADPYHYDHDAKEFRTRYYDQGIKGVILSSDYEDNHELTVLLLQNDSDKASIIGQDREIWTPVRCVESKETDQYFDIPDPFADEP